MSIDSDVYTALTGSSALVTLVGSRIYNGIARQTVVAPFVVFQVLSASPAAVHAGAAEIAEYLVQVSCYATTQASAIAIRDAVIAAIDGVAVSTGNTGTLHDMRNGYEEAVDLYRCDADFVI